MNTRKRNVASDNCPGKFRGVDANREFHREAFGKASRSGMTLLEMLVAISLTIVLVTLLAQVLATTLDGVHAAKGVAAIHQRVRAAIYAVRTDLKDIYIGRSGNRLSVASLFTQPDRIPNAGYFTIEENDRALREGIDANGLPVEIDTDDVLAFTTRRAGTSRDQVYYGRVEHLDDKAHNVMVSGQLNDLGEYLDNFHGTGIVPTNFNTRGTKAVPVSFNRFDGVNDRLLTSRSAEVVYFLRPNRQQPSVDQIAVDPTQPTQAPPVPVLYTLYRRQLLVVDDADKLNRGSTLQYSPESRFIPEQGILLEHLHPFYQHFDISACREYSTEPGDTKWRFGREFRVHFNSLEDLSKRENRYGMRLMQFDNPASPFFHEDVPFYRRRPSAWSPALENNPAAPRYIYRAVPMSHDLSSRPYVHAYKPWGRTPPRWFGRPTLSESAHPAFPFWNDYADDKQGAAYSLGIGVDLRDGPDNSVRDQSARKQSASDGVLDAYPYDGQRAGEDILLTNVLSFDIKVFEESSDIVSAINPLREFGAMLPERVVPNAAAVHGGAYPNSMHAHERRAEFVDLGYFADHAEVLSRSAKYNRGPSVANDKNVLTCDYGPKGGDHYGPSAPQTYMYHSRIAPFGVVLRPQDLGQMAYGLDGKPGFAGRDEDPKTGKSPGNGIIDDPEEYNESAPIGDDQNIFQNMTPARQYCGPDGVWGKAGDDDGNGVPDDVTEFLWPGSDDWHPVLGMDNNWGVAGEDDNRDGIVDDPSEYMAWASDDQPFYGNFETCSNYPAVWSPRVRSGPPDSKGKSYQWRLFGSDGQEDTPGRKTSYDSTSGGASWPPAGLVGTWPPPQPFLQPGIFVNAYGTSGQIGWLPLNDKDSAIASPRNTYDSWSSEYAASPFLMLDANTQKSVSEDIFRPVPYPRPLKGIQIRLRVYIPESGLTQDFTIRHAFD